MKTKKTLSIRRMTSLAILIALVAVLQVISLVPINPIVGITLALAPIVVGAILFGPISGAFLGAVMGAVVFVSVVMGQAGALSTAMLQLNPIVTFLVCILKSSFAGLASGLVYRAIAKTGKQTLAIIIAAIVCPIVNTGLFVAALLTVFHSVAAEYAALSDASMAKFVIVMILGVNFILEFVINSALSPAIVRIISIVRKSKLAQ